MRVLHKHTLLSRLLTQLMQQLRSPPHHVNSLLPLSSLQQQLQRNTFSSQVLRLYRMVSQGGCQEVH
jgi:hypothetical protein